MPDSATPPNSKSKEKPKRNPTERLLVWGGIGVMIVVAGFEGVARYGYTNTLPVLQARMVEDDAATDARSLTLAEADTLVAGFPSKTDEGNKVIYRWKGLLKDHGAIHLSYDEEKNVTGLETDTPPEIEEQVFSESDDDEDLGMGEGGGPPGGGGSGTREEDGSTEGDGSERSESEGGRPQRPGTDEAAPPGSTPTSTPEPHESEEKPKAAAEVKPEAKAEEKAEAKAEPAPKEE